MLLRKGISLRQGFPVVDAKFRDRKKKAIFMKSSLNYDRR